MDKKITAIDLFCGVGGLSYGLQEAGIKVKAGIDFDPSCQYAFEKNCKSKFIHSDITNVTSEEVNALYESDDIKVLVGCAPCQPFSTYTLNVEKPDDQRWRLLYEFQRLIQDIQPDIISMENVPNLLNFKKEPVFKNFVDVLESTGYHVWYNIVFAPDYGIPQRRKRLVLLASKKGKISLIEPTHKPHEYLTVQDAIGSLEKIGHGETSKIDIIHRAAKLSDKNLERIKQSKPGGSWKTDWHDDLKLKCHLDEKGKTYGSVYGRMEWAKPSPTMTTFCTGIGNGRFGHPEQDRALTLREAAILQSFPPHYEFVDQEENLKVRQIARQIGNAVPPKLGEVIGKSIIQHIKGCHNGEN